MTRPIRPTRRWYETRQAHDRRVVRYRQAVREELERQRLRREVMSRPQPGLRSLAEAALSGLSGSARISIESGALTFNDGTTAVISPRERILIAAVLTADRQERCDG